MFRTNPVALQAALPCEEHDQMYHRSVLRKENSSRRRGEIQNASIEVMWESAIAFRRCRSTRYWQGYILE